MSDIPAAVEVRGLTKVFGTGVAQVEALRGIDLSVTAGEFVAAIVVLQAPRDRDSQRPIGRQRLRESERKGSFPLLRFAQGPILQRRDGCRRH